MSPQAIAWDGAPQASPVAQPVPRNSATQSVQQPTNAVTWDDDALRTGVGMEQYAQQQAHQASSQLPAGAGEVPRARFQPGMRFEAQGLAKQSETPTGATDPELTKQTIKNLAVAVLSTVAPELLPEGSGMLARAAATGGGAYTGSVAGQTAIGDNPLTAQGQKEALGNAATYGGSELGAGIAGKAISNITKLAKPATKVAEEAGEFGIPLSASQMSGRGAAIEAGLKKLPIFNSPFSKLGYKQAAEISDNISQIADQIAGSPGATPTERGEAIQEALRGAKSVAGDAYSNAMDTIRDAGGGAAKLNAERLANTASNLTEQIKPVSGYAKGFEAGPRQRALDILENFTNPERPLSFDEAVKLRRQIFEESTGGEMTPYKGALKQMNSALHLEAKSALERGGLEDLADNFENASSQYRNVMEALDDKVPKAVLKRDPGTVASYLLSNATPTSVQSLKTLARDKMPEIGRTVWEQMFDQASQKSSPASAGKEVARLWNKVGPDTATALYGADQAAKMQRFVDVVSKVGLGRPDGLAQLGFFGKTAVAGGGIGAVTHPMLALTIGAKTAPATVSLYALSRLMAKPAGITALTDVLTAANSRALRTATLALLNEAHNVNRSDLK